MFYGEINDKRKKILYFFVIIMTLVSVNMLNLLGLFLSHFVVISLIVEGLVWILKKVVDEKKVLHFLEKGKYIYNLGIIPLVLTSIIFGYGYINIHNIVEKDYYLETDKKLDRDYKILLLTDVHYGSVFGKKELLELKERVNKEKIDIILLAGDIVDENTTKEEMEYVFKVLGELNNQYGIYYVYGNHDQQVYQTKTKYLVSALNSTLEINGIKLLVDNYVEVNDDIVVVGRNDYHFQRKSVDNIIGDIPNSKYIIMMDHQPKDYKSNIANGVDLIVSGHTHGGQLFPLGLLINLFKTSEMNYGHKKIDNMDAVVSSGVMGWGYPIRTEKHSEIVFINIKRK